MRLLLVTPFVPDAHAAHGGGLYLGALGRALAEHAELGLVALTDSYDEIGHLGEGPWSWHATLPRPTRPRSRSRRIGHQARMALHWGVRRLPLVAAKHWHPQLPGLLRRACARFRPDAALVELAQMAQYLPCLGAVPTVFTDHESGLPANVHTDLGAWADRRDVRLWDAYVRRYYRFASLLQALTDEDARELSARLERPVATRVPTVPIPPEPVAPERAPPRALFLGSYAHRPNPEAAELLARDVLPRVRALVPDAELWLAGPDCERIAALGALPGVVIRGFVPDLHELFGQVRLLLAPIYSGGGFRMKSFTALAHGVPVVTNALGGRGCSAPEPARVVVEDRQALADAAAALLRAPQRAQLAGRAAHAWAREHLAPESVARAQVERIRALLGR